MKKPLLLTLVLGLFMFGAKAQSFEQGDIVAQFGLGLGGTISLSGFGFGLPIGGGLEYGITDEIGVGVDVGFQFYDDVNVYYAGPKGYYHFGELLELPEEFDLYGGMTILYRRTDYNDDLSFVDDDGDIGVGFHAGGRYYFSNNFGVYGEIGNTYAWLKAGVCLKL